MPLARVWKNMATRLGLGSGKDPLADGPGAPEPIDVAAELSHLKRGLRRLSLASEQQCELLQGLSARLQALDQSVLRLGLARDGAVRVDEATLLRLLDQLDKALALPGLPEPVSDTLCAVQEALLAAAGWRPAAIPGAPPEGVHLRVAEVLPGASGGAFRIHHILEQGYLRADGSVMRAAVVVAAAEAREEDVQNLAQTGG